MYLVQLWSLVITNYLLINFLKNKLVFTFLETSLIVHDTFPSNSFKRTTIRTWQLMSTSIFERSLLHVWVSCFRNWVCLEDEISLFECICIIIVYLSIMHINLLNFFLPFIKYFIISSYRKRKESLFELKSCLWTVEKVIMS